MWKHLFIRFFSLACTLPVLRGYSQPINLTSNRPIHEYTVQFQGDKQNRDGNLQQEYIQLLQQQARLQQASLRQAQLLRNALLCGSILLALLLAVLYSRYRTKQKANRLLRFQQQVINRSNRELQRLNARQQRLLAEKEWLMSEVHHRVKTNLQIVTSLLNMQVAYLNDAFTLHAFGEIGSRIRTLSLIHQRLYCEEGDMTMINMRDYIHELAGYLADTHADTRSIVINEQIEPIELNIAQCVPVGLILNEAISNALRHAFPHRLRLPETPVPNGTIDITMRLDAGGQITLVVADNGIGLPTDFDPNRQAAMGWQLIKTLGQQLDGVTHIENHNGLRITVIFQQQESPLPV